MTPEEAAAVLNGQEYNYNFSVGNKELYATMKADGLVAVYGEGDDNMEFRGAIYDELSAYNGTTAYLDKTGLLTNECSNDDCPHFDHKKKGAKTIDAVWCGGDGISWTFKTEIPHVTFDIMEEDEVVFCRGIVFRLEDAA